MMTLSTVGLGAALRTAAISACTASASPAMSNPRLMTMSTSSAPLRTASAASAALMSALCLPEGNPTTVHTFTGPMLTSSIGSIAGETQMDQVPSCTA